MYEKGVSKRFDSYIGLKIRRSKQMMLIINLNTYWGILQYKFHLSISF